MVWDTNSKCIGATTQHVYSRIYSHISSVMLRCYSVLRIANKCLVLVFLCTCVPNLCRFFISKCVFWVFAFSWFWLCPRISLLKLDWYFGFALNLTQYPVSVVFSYTKQMSIHFTSSDQVSASGPNPSWSSSNKRDN